jgi:hypothetical protein
VEEYIQNGTIHPKLERAEAIKLIKPPPFTKKRSRPAPTPPTESVEPVEPEETEDDAQTTANERKQQYAEADGSGNGNGAKPSRKYGGSIDYNYWIRKMLQFTFEETMIEFQEWLDKQIETNSLTTMAKFGIIKALRDCSLHWEKIAQDLVERGPEFVPPPDTTIGLETR